MRQYDRSNETNLRHKTFKENLLKANNDNTVYKKTSNEYSDNEHIDFDLIGTATNVSNLSSINKNNINAYDIINANEEKTVEAPLVESVPISAPDNYIKDNLHLAEAIGSTIDQFKAFIKKARKCTEGNDCTVNEIAHSSSKKLEDIFEETRTWKKGTTLLICHSILLPNTR